MRKSQREADIHVLFCALFLFCLVKVFSINDCMEKYASVFFVLQNRCSCKCCRFSLEGARSNCMCPELRACMCTPRSIKSSKLRTLLCGAFDAVSFSMGDVGSHWSNGLCCGDLVQDNYAADDSSGVFFFSSCRRVCFCSAYLGWTGSWSMGCRD